MNCNSSNFHRNGIPFSYSRTIRLADTDAAGVVYFTQVLAICHEAYEACLEDSKLSLPSLVQAFKIALPIIHAEVDFFRPLGWGDTIEAQVFPELTSETEFAISYKIIAESDTKAVASTRHVCIDSETRKRVFLPAALQAWLQ